MMHMSLHRFIWRQHQQYQGLCEGLHQVLQRSLGCNILILAIAQAWVMLHQRSDCIYQHQSCCDSLFIPTVLGPGVNAMPGTPNNYLSM